MADRLTRSRVRPAWLFLAPMLIILALVAAWPLIRTIWLGFTDANLLKMEEAKWIGLDNYTGDHGLLQDKIWWKAVKNTLWFTMLTVTIETVLGTLPPGLRSIRLSSGEARLTRRAPWSSVRARTSNSGS